MNRGEGRWDEEKGEWKSRKRIRRGGERKADVKGIRKGGKHGEENKM